MIFSILVTGALSDTRDAFVSRFLVDTVSEDAAIEAVESELDWSGAAHHKAKSEGVAGFMPSMPNLTPGIPQFAGA
jgi:hypothetical protein